MRDASVGNGERASVQATAVRRQEGQVSARARKREHNGVLRTRGRVGTGVRAAVSPVPEPRPWTLAADVYRRIDVDNGHT